MFSHVYKLITPVRWQVMTKGIAFTIERVERRVGISIVHRAGVRLIKTVEIWRKVGGKDLGIRCGVVTFIGGMVVQIWG